MTGYPRPRLTHNRTAMNGGQDFLLGMAGLCLCVWALLAPDWHMRRAGSRVPTGETPSRTPVRWRTNGGMKARTGCLGSDAHAVDAG